METKTISWEKCRARFIKIAVKKIRNQNITLCGQPKEVNEYPRSMYSE